MTLASRVLAKINKYGELFTVVGGGTYKGIFAILDSTIANTYLNYVDTLGIIEPSVIIYTQPDAVAVIYDEIVRDGRTYVVMRAYEHVDGDNPIFKLLVLG